MTITSSGNPLLLLLFFFILPTVYITTGVRDVNCQKREQAVYMTRISPELHSWILRRTDEIVNDLDVLQNAIEHKTKAPILTLVAYFNSCLDLLVILDLNIPGLEYLEHEKDLYDDSFTRNLANSVQDYVITTMTKMIELEQSMKKNTKPSQKWIDLYEILDMLSKQVRFDPWIVSTINSFFEENKAGQLSYRRRLFKEYNEIK